MNPHNLEQRARESLLLLGGLSEHKKIIHNLLAKVAGLDKARLDCKETTIDYVTQYLETLRENQELRLALNKKGQQERESNEAGLAQGYDDGWCICQDKNNKLIADMGKQLFDAQAQNTLLRSQNALLEDAATIMEKTVDYFCNHVTHILKVNAELRGALEACKQALRQYEDDPPTKGNHHGF
jgi:hypothetical protein